MKFLSQNQSFPPPVQDSLLSAVQNSWETNVFKGNLLPLTSVAISTDNQTIVSGVSDGTVRLWNRKGQQLAEIKSHQVSVNSVAISTDNQTIVSGGFDGTVRLWDRKHRQLAELKDYQGSVNSVAISTDNQTIVSGVSDGIVRLWDIKFESWLKAACERLRYHPVFQKPESSEEKGAKATCMPYLRDL